MDIDIKDLSADKLRDLQFLVGERLEGSVRVWIARYGITWGGVRQWLVYDTDQGNGSCRLFTTAEMPERYRSIRLEDGTPIPASPEVKGKLLAQAGLARMKLKDGCPGCLRLWKFPRGSSRCRKCGRCLNCCLSAKVKNSCEYKLRKKMGYPL